VNRGEIYLCHLDAEPRGHEAGFTRPVLVVSEAGLNRHGLAVVAAITSKRRGYATHIELDGVLPVTSYIQCEQLRTVATERLVKLLGWVDPATMAKVEAVARRLLGL
jgi:mRNA interferase MazF